MNDTQKMSPAQFAFTVASFLQSSTLLVTLLLPVLQQDTWIAILISVATCLPLIFIYSYLMRSFPDKNLMQILETVFGRILGYGFCLLYASFFLILSAANLRYFGEFISQTFMPKTPTPVMMCACIFLCAWASRGGFSVAFRFDTLFTVFGIGILMFSLILVYPLFRTENFLPIMQHTPIKVTQGVHLLTSLFFGECVCLLMVGPSVNQGKRPISLYWMMGFAIGFLTLLLAVMRDTGVLGPAMSIFSQPFLETFRLITINGKNVRVELLFLITLASLFVNRMLTLSYASILSVTHILRQAHVKPFVFLICAGILVLARMVSSSAMELIEVARAELPFIWSVFSILLPILTAVMVKVRGLGEKKAKVSA